MVHSTPPTPPPPPKGLIAEEFLSPCDLPSLSFNFPRKTAPSCASPQMPMFIQPFPSVFSIFFPLFLSFPPTHEKTFPAVDIPSTPFLPQRCKIPPETREAPPPRSSKSSSFFSPFLSLPSADNSSTPPTSFFHSCFAVLSFFLPSFFFFSLVLFYFSKVFYETRFTFSFYQSYFPFSFRKCFLPPILHYVSPPLPYPPE